MKQITQIALLIITLLGFLAVGNHALSAENQSNSDTSETQEQRIEKQNKNSIRLLNLHKSWIRNREKTAKRQQQIEKEVVGVLFRPDTLPRLATEESISRSIGGRAEFDLSTVPSFFTRTRDVLLFVPKKIGAGVIYLGRGTKHLLWW